MISFTEDKKKFNFRVAGVLIQDDYVLLHRCIRDSFWALPGGRLEFMETCEHTIIREMKEEIDLDVRVNRQLFQVQSFFEYNNLKYHEMGIYYLIDANIPLEMKLNEVFKGIEETEHLIFKWFHLNQLKEIELYPAFLKEALLNLPTEITCVVERS